MALLATRMGRMKPSSTMAMAQKARALKDSGRDVISLSAGEPDFETPDPIKQAAIQAIHKGETRYTNPDGTPQLKRAVQDKFRRENGIAYDLDEIIISSGGKQVIYNAFAATLDAGDEVIIPAPYWVSYPDIVELLEATPVYFDCLSENRFCPNLPDLEAVITERSKWLVLNFPGNPTGAVMDGTQLRALAELLERHPQLHVMTDDIYEHLVFSDTKRFATLAEVAPQLRDRILTINGVSKAYCMTGWRIGYGGGPKTLIRAMKDLQSQSTSCPASISQAAAVAALTDQGNFIAENNQRYRARRDMVVAALNGIDGLHCDMPDGAFYIFASCAGVIGKKTATGVVLADDECFVTELLEQTGVAVVHGGAFGMSPFFRISFATSDALLMAACDRIGEFCAALHE